MDFRNETNKNMSERSGSKYARELFQSSITKEIENKWRDYDDRYQEALEIIAQQKKKPDLLELDQFLHQSLPGLIRARNPPHIIHSELAQIMKWKLTRGKMRPLQKLVESNHAQTVISTSTNAFRELEQGHIKEAFDIICELKGIGIATASAIFSLISPGTCPFMADEVIESSTSHGRDYTYRVFSDMNDALQRKATELGWNAERVGKSLWVCAIIGDRSEDDAPVVKVTGKRGSKAAQETPEESNKSKKRAKTSKK